MLRTRVTGSPGTQRDIAFGVVQLGSAVDSFERVMCTAIFVLEGLNPRSAQWWLSDTSPACSSLIPLLGAGRGGESCSSFPATWMEIPQNNFKPSAEDAGRRRKGIRCRAGPRV